MKTTSKKKPASVKRATKKQKAKPPTASATRDVKAKKGSGKKSGVRKKRLSLKLILVPYDFSGEADKALRYAVPFAEQFGARILMLHVVEPVAYPDFAYVPVVMENETLVEEGRKKLKQISRDTSNRRPLKVDAMVRTGKPFQEITDVAREKEVDLIIVATHGYTGLSHVLLGSTAESVVRHAPCPVLVVRQNEHEFIK